MRPAIPLLRSASRHSAAVLLCGVFLCATAAAAQPSAAEPRVALVIGNAAYATAPLRNPVNDATAIAERLRALGFDVALRTNVTQREMTRAVSQFGQSLKPGSVGLFYYAGHGMQVRGRNFLIPVDADIQGEASARSESVDLDLVLEQLGPTRLAMVILDACRNNPFEGRFRSGAGGGLAQVDAPKGTLLAYATAPGKVASDGEGSHGLYTSELLKAMDIPGAKVEEVFKAVRVNVIQATSGQQVPWESSSLTGDYYFRPAPAADASLITRETASKQAELQAKLDAERQQRELEAQQLKAEMEKLRQELQRLAKAADAAPPPVQAPAQAPATSRKEPGAQPPEPKPEPKKAAPPVASHPEPSSPKAASADEWAPANARQTWGRRIRALESQRGQLTYSKATAILFAPLTDEQLLVLVERERALRNTPYSNALAIGINAAGGVAAGRSVGERTPGLATESALERCKKESTPPCSVVMVNGAFSEEAFIEWARHATSAKVAGIRQAFLRPSPPVRPGTGPS